MKKYISYFLAGTAIYFGFAGLGYAETTVSAEDPGLSLPKVIDPDIMYTSSQ